MKLLDTAIAVDHLRGRPDATVFIESAIRQDGALAASELTRFELLAGMRPGEEASLEGFFAVLDWVPVTEGIALEHSPLPHVPRPAGALPPRVMAAPPDPDPAPTGHALATSRARLSSATAEVGRR